MQLQFVEQLCEFVTGLLEVEQIEWSFGVGVAGGVEGGDGADLGRWWRGDVRMDVRTLRGTVSFNCFVCSLELQPLASSVTVFMY